MAEKKIQSEKTVTPIHEKLTTISENWKQSAFRLSVVKPNLNSHNSQEEDKKIPLRANENSKQKPNCLKRGKTRATKSRLVLFLHPIGWESGASFLNQSQSEVKH